MFPTPITPKPLLSTPNQNIIYWFFFSFLLFFIVFRPLTPCFSNKNARISAVLVTNLRYLLAFLPLFSKGSRFVRNLTYFLFELFRYGPLIEKKISYCLPNFSMLLGLWVCLFKLSDNLFATVIYDISIFILFFYFAWKMQKLCQGF